MTNERSSLSNFKVAFFCKIVIDFNLKDIFEHDISDSVGLN